VTYIDLQETYRPYLCQQFTICYDVYLEVKRRTQARIFSALGWDSNWRLKHACPACTYELVDEAEMTFSMLACMDSNESLRRVLRREVTEEFDDEMGDQLPGKSKERMDSRDAGQGYFLSREDVDEWAKSRLADMLPTDKIPVRCYFLSF
jgi:ferredoxin-like protein FixX